MNEIFNRVKWIACVICLGFFLWGTRGLIADYGTTNAAVTGAGSLWGITWLMQNVFWVMAVFFLLVAIVVMIIAIRKSGR